MPRAVVLRDIHRVPISYPRRKEEPIAALTCISIVCSTVERVAKSVIFLIYVSREGDCPNKRTVGRKSKIGPTVGRHEICNRIDVHSKKSTFQLWRQTVRKNLLPAIGLVLALSLVAATALASVTDFAGFTLGTVNYKGPGGTTTTSNGYVIPDPYGSLWTVVDEWGQTVKNFDEEVMDVDGNRVWRFSNAVAGGYSDQPNSPSSPEVAGEETAFLYNDRGPDHTHPQNSPPNHRAGATTPTFHSVFKFKSSTGAAQPKLFIAVNPIPRQTSYRMSYVGIEATGTGFESALSLTPRRAGTLVRQPLPVIFPTLTGTKSTSMSSSSMASTQTGAATIS